MPVYDYFCEENGLTLEVSHPMETILHTWIELCYVSQHSLGDTDPMSPVRKVTRTAPGISVAVFNSELRNQGFTKLVKRDDGVYENVTALDQEKKFMKRGDPSGIPHIHRKISD